MDVGRTPPRQLLNLAREVSCVRESASQTKADKMPRTRPRPRIEIASAPERQSRDRRASKAKSSRYDRDDDDDDFEDDDDVDDVEDDETVQRRRRSKDRKPSKDRDRAASSVASTQSRASRSAAASTALAPTRASASASSIAQNRKAAATASRSVLQAAHAKEKRAILSAIARSQLSGTSLLSRPAFQRHIDLLTSGRGVRVGAAVCQLLQEATESYLVELLTHARCVATHAGRDALRGADVQLVAEIRGDRLRFPAV